MKKQSPDSLSSNKKHKARPMDAYQRDKAVMCVDDPHTKYVCRAAKIKDRYLTAEEIKEEFNLLINSHEPTF